MDENDISRFDRHERAGGVCLYTHWSIPILEELVYDDGTCQGLVTLLPSNKLSNIVLHRPPCTEENIFKSLMHFIQSVQDDYTDDSC